MTFVIILEEVFEFGLVENDDVTVDDGDLVIVGYFESDFGGEGLKALAIKLPGAPTFEGGRGGNGFGDIEYLGAALTAGIGEAGDDTFDFLELVDVVTHGVDVTIFVFDEVNQGFGAADVGEFGAVNYLIFTVRFFVFAAFEAFVGFFDDVTGGFLHEKGFDAGGELVGVTDAVGGVIFIKEEEFDGDVVFNFVDFVGPMKNVERIRWGCFCRCSVDRSVVGRDDGISWLCILIFHIYLAFGLL